jgi:hypothetical protein
MLIFSKILHMYVFTCFPRVTDSLTRATVAILFGFIYLRSCPTPVGTLLNLLCTSLYVVLSFTDSLRTTTATPLFGVG